MANNHVIDRLLVARAQSGEEAAFTFLVRRWNPKLVGFCYKLSGNAEAARDIAQETWVAVVGGSKNWTIRRASGPGFTRSPPTRRPIISGRYRGTERRKMKWDKWQR